MRAINAVYLAVAGSRRGRDRDSRVHRLCRLLGLGLLIVDTRHNTVAVVAEPTAYKPRLDLRMRKRLLTEHQTATGRPDGWWFHPSADHDGLPATRSGLRSGLG